MRRAHPEISTSLSTCINTCARVSSLCACEHLSVFLYIYIYTYVLLHARISSPDRIHTICCCIAMVVHTRTRNSMMDGGVTALPPQCSSEWPRLRVAAPSRQLRVLPGSHHVHIEQSGWTASFCPDPHRGAAQFHTQLRRTKHIHTHIHSNVTSHITPTPPHYPSLVNFHTYIDRYIHIDVLYRTFKRLMRLSLPHILSSLSLHRECSRLLLHLPPLSFPPSRALNVSQNPAREREKDLFKIQQHT